MTISLQVKTRQLRLCIVMDSSSLTNVTRKKRSFTFGDYESVTKDEDVTSSQRRNLIASPLRSVVSGVGVPARKRSSTWHGAAVQVNQVDKGEDLSPVKNDDISAAASLKETFCTIITEELSDHLENEKDLKSSHDFVEKSGTIAKVISTRARQLVGYNSKIVSSVFIGEIRGDGIEVASQCLFEPSQDAFASGNFKSPDIFAVGSLFVTTYDASLHGCL